MIARCFQIDWNPFLGQTSTPQPQFRAQPPAIISTGMVQALGFEFILQIHSCESKSDQLECIILA
jgi:hypothetical protein